MNASWSRRACAVTFGLFIGLVGLGACGGDDNQALGNGFPGTGGGMDATVAETGADSAPSVVLCTEYGGYSFVQKLTTDLMGILAADCRIDAYFTVGTDSTTHIGECLTQQLGTFFACPGVTYDKDSKGNKCRSMSDSHQNLNLSSADFDAFVDDFVTALQANKVTSSDVQEIVPTILGLKTQIVRGQAEGNSQCTCPGDLYDGGSCVGPDAGDDGGDSGMNEAGTDSGDDGGGGTADAGVDAADANPPDDASGE